jgi:TetR/AcrR family transcriptional regulator, transcriptional repressor for nem operon
MPRNSASIMQQNRSEIIAVASRLFREHGTANVTVADIMSAVGMTHGGFYRHFDSKDDLVRVACDYAFDQTAEARKTWIEPTEGGVPTVKALVGNYLSAMHRDNPGTGCPTSALAVDVAREPIASPLRSSYTAEIKKVIEEFESAIGEGASREQAIVMLAALVGALTISRATKGDPLSDDTLTAVRSLLPGLTKLTPELDL